MNDWPRSERYQVMRYNRCGQSGLKLPVISLGLWHNFGDVSLAETGREMLRQAFDLGITHFDLANNYGPPPGAAEENFGKILNRDFKGFRDEMVISTKAGYSMWPGPYGDWGSKKYLVASLDQSLRRMGLDYVDIFYHHRPDPETPLEETMAAMDLIVRQGKALYAGISNYRPEQAKAAIGLLQELGTPCLIHQTRYSMFDRQAEDGLLKLLKTKGVGCIAFSPLAKGMLTERYLQGIPEDSRAAGQSVFLKPEDITEALIAKVRKLDAIAKNRGQKLAQMALAWILRNDNVTAVLIGASKVSQIRDCAAAIDNLSFTREELERIEAVLKD